MSELLGILQNYTSEGLSNSETLAIKVTLMALIRRPDDFERTSTVTVHKGTSAYLLLSDMGYSKEEIMLFQLFITNTGSETVKIQRKYELRHKDELFVTIPVGGG